MRPADVLGTRMVSGRSQSSDARSAELVTLADGPMPPHGDDPHRGEANGRPPPSYTRDARGYRLEEQRQLTGSRGPLRLPAKGGRSPGPRSPATKRERTRGSCSHQRLRVISDNALRRPRVRAADGSRCGAACGRRCQVDRRRRTLDVAAGRTHGKGLSPVVRGRPGQRARGSRSAVPLPGRRIPRHHGLHRRHPSGNVAERPRSGIHSRHGRQPA